MNNNYGFGSWISLILLLVITLTSACQQNQVESDLPSETGTAIPSDPDFGPESQSTSTMPMETAPKPESAQDQSIHGLTYQYADGNRIIQGSGTLPFAKTIPGFYVTQSVKERPTKGKTVIIGKNEAI